MRLADDKFAQQIAEEALGLPHSGANAVPWLDRSLGLVVAIILFSIMAITFIDVFMRYWFAAPITGSAEIVKFAMAVLIFSALPLVTLAERHITVGLLHGRLAAHAAWLQRLFVLAVSVAAVAVMAWQLAEHGLDLAHDQVTTTVLEWPLAPLSYFMSALATVTLGVLLLLLMRHVKAFPK